MKVNDSLHNLNFIPFLHYETFIFDGVEAEAAAARKRKESRK